MIELLVQVVDVTHPDALMNAELPKRGEVLSAIVPPCEFSESISGHPDRLVVSVDVTIEEIAPYLLPSIEPDPVAMTVPARDRRLDVDALRPGMTLAELEAITIRLPPPTSGLG